MQAQPKTIREILHTGDQYVIPLFQRYYSWGKTHWERLRTDVWALMENGGKPVHFLGPLVCHLPSKMPGTTTSFQLIDGQQRLTTLTIFLAAIRDVAASRGLKEFAEEITEDYLLFKRKQGSERYIILPRLGDREVLMAMIEGRDLVPFADSPVFQAWKYFQRHVQHLSRRDTEKQLRRLLDVVTTRLNLVVVVIDGENPYEIFDSLNSTGLPLKQSDLIRNFVFMDISAARQQSFDDQHWKPFEDLFEKTSHAAAVDMTAFYRDYLARDGRYIKEDATFEDFKATHEAAVKRPEELVTTLRHYAELDLMLRRPRSVSDPALRSMLRQVGGMDISTAFPLLLNLLDRHRRGKLSTTDLCGCLLDLVSFVLRRSICGESTRPYGRWFVEAITMIRENPRADLQAYWLERRWPDDEAVRKRLPAFELYRRESTKTRAVLERLEESFGHRERVDLSTLTIEHVMPQTITNNKNGKAWKEMLGADWETLQGELLHTLGNLTLTGYNPELSNSPFETKQIHFLDSHIDLNAHFEKLKKWDADAVRARATQLTEKVIELWPRPKNSVAYAASAEAMSEPSGLSAGAKTRLEYWRHLDVRLEERGVSPDLITPTPDSSLPISVGATGSVEFTLSFNRSQRKIHVLLTLTGKAGERIGHGLEKEKEAIHAELQYALTWNFETAGAKISVSDDGIQIRDVNDWPVQHDWFGDRLEDFQRVLQPRVLVLEAEVLNDPALKRELDQQAMRRDYWRACAAVVNDQVIQVRERDSLSGRVYCRLASLDEGISLGVQLSPDSDWITVYLGVSTSASAEQQLIFKQMAESQLAELSELLGQDVKKDGSYLYVGLDTKESRDDWPRQHRWIKDSALKVLEVFKPRLQIE